MGSIFEPCYCRGRMLTHFETTETNSGQSILPIGQTRSRGAEDGKSWPHPFVSSTLTSSQGKQIGEEGGIVRQTTE